MADAPEIDGRDREELFEHAVGLAPHYVEEWDPAADDAGTALVGLFAELAEEVVERLDQVPEKHRVGFFDALGFSRRPPVPATVPLAFEAADGVDAPVPIPGGTQAVGDGPEATFEVAAGDGFEATPATVDRVYSVDPARDRVFEHSADLDAEEPVELFGGTDLQEHALHVAHADQLALSPGSTVQVVLETAAARSTLVGLAWEYYGEDPDGEEGWHPLSVRDVEADGEAGSIREVTLALKVDGEVTETTVDGIESRWIRCRDRGDPPAALFDLELRSVAVGAGADLPPDLLLQGDVPLDPEKGSVRPFGRIPRRRDAFYVASEEAFTKAGTTVTVEFEEWLGEGTAGDPDLSWEYWNGDAWALLDLVEPDGEDDEGGGQEDGGGDVRDLQTAGTVAFEAPPDVEATSVAGHEGHWIRARLVGGDYGEVTYEEEDGTFTENAEGVHEPHYGGVRIGYGGERAATHLLARNNLAYGDDRAGADGFRPFERLPGETQGVYFGFDRALKNGPLNVLLPLADAEYETGFYPRVRWERWDPDDGWTRVAASDGTESLTERGIVSLTFEEPTVATERFGERRHWIRARVADDQFAPGTASRDREDPTVPVEISGIYPVAEHVVIDNVGDRPVDLSGFRVDFEYGQPATQVRTFPRGTVVGPGESLVVATGTKSEGPADVWFDYDRWVLNREEPDTVVVESPDGDLVAVRPDSLDSPPWPGIDAIRGRDPDGADDGEGGAGTEREDGTVEGEAGDDGKGDCGCGGRKHGDCGGATSRRPPPCEGALASTPPAGEPGRGPPVLEGLYPNAVWARNVRTVSEEIVGSSDGTRGQAFTVADPPAIEASVWVDELRVLSEGRRRDLEAERPDGVVVETDADGDERAFWVRWREVPDLHGSSSGDRHYTLDRTTGRIEFGDGTRGRIPPRGRDNVRVSYRTGGGTAGNVDRGAIADLKGTIPNVESVTNPLPADGGADEETREGVLRRAPEELRDRGRAVAAEDFERIARDASRELARVRCVPAMDRAGERTPGYVTLVVVPSSSRPKPVPSATLREEIRSAVADRAPATLVADPERFVVRGPSYVSVDVEAELSVTGGSISAVEEAATDAVASFLHPLAGGHAGDGWSFGDGPCHSDLFALLEGLDRVDHVAELTLHVRGSESTVTVREGEEAPRLSADALVHSGTHEIAAVVDHQSSAVVGGS